MLGKVSLRISVVTIIVMTHYSLLMSDIITKSTTITE